MQPSTEVFQVRSTPCYTSTLRSMLVALAVAYKFYLHVVTYTVNRVHLTKEEGVIAILTPKVYSNAPSIPTAPRIPIPALNLRNKYTLETKY